MPPFSNIRIVIPKDNILCCGDPENQYNNILKVEMQLGKDYQLISKDQWTLLEQSYTMPNTAPIYTMKRSYEKLGVGIRTFPDIHYHKVY